MSGNSRTILSRPRTRIYDSNYNIGESYYKSALDRLDRKYSGRPLSPPRGPSSAVLDIADRHARAFAEDDIEESRRRASNRIRENNVFDSRGARFSRASDSFEENGITDETASTLQRIRASKKVSYVDDLDLESTSNNLKTQRLLDRSEKILDSIGINESSASKRALENEFSYQKRTLKATYDAEGDNLTKWQPMPAPQENGEVVASAAALRARKSRARIDDIDDEMAAMQEKQAARERRVARLKQLVAECDSETVSDSGVAINTLAITEKKVRF
ncbi:uncharacterized protein LOC126739484 [Anthonomus grandis grandis]|uniref:uncharacterized protein LOC126739484 n=1 Tax=Anthonomus grandis grandis TaxID=2921223 RepID=UPI0021653D4F|nr:uncharacterized protein LOC126739484 [Anthonomus grandis grandis]XP_050301131.1 uncharacterized protein LOC126739484 [Anthonomus grandis grandis]XP_050301132.1 uncharacterized protein LOC126739484 [Anthonomus grandis grandis]